MFELLDDIFELVYITDPDTYEVLYVNDTGKKTFHIDSLEGLKCYEVFQGQDAPCYFCTTKYLSKEARNIYTWSYVNKLTKRCYLLKDRLIDWNGRNARMEIAFDITDVAEENKKPENALDAENMLLCCIHCLHEESNLRKSISGMLKQLGENLCAERAYVFEFKNDQMFDAFEWCATQVSPQISWLQSLEVGLVDRWIPFFNKGECIILSNVEALRDSDPDEYEALHTHNITSMVAAPLERDGKLIGFFGVDNPPAERIENIAPLLTALSYFLSSAIRQADDTQKMATLSLCDTLTGLNNRNCYLKDMERLKIRTDTLGVVYMDLNGLKEINDRGGHCQGDRALVWCAEKIKEIFPDGKHYRIGGGEFLVFQLSLPRDAFQERVDKLRKAFSSSSPYQMAIGARWGNARAAINRMVLEADTDMYEDKRRFYSGHQLTGRYRVFGEPGAFSVDNPLMKEYNMLMSAMRVSVSKHLMRRDFKVLWANDSFYKMTGYSQEEYDELFHANCEEFFADTPKEYDDLCRLVRAAYDDGKPTYESVLRMPQRNGVNIWTKVTGTFTDEIIEGVPVIYAVFTDINDLMQAQREQSITYEKLPGFVAKLQIGPDKPSLLYGNTKFTAFFGEQEGGRPTPLLTANLQRNWPAIQAHYSELRRGETVNFKAETISSDGEIGYFQVCADCVDWVQQDPVYLVVFIDTTEIMEQRRQLENIAYVDPVTGGPNRTRFEEDAGGAVKASPPNTYCLASVDLQKFKVINDLFGIEAGDRILRHLYNRIHAHLHPGEYAARISSDVFSVLLFKNDQESAGTRIQEIAEDVNAFNNALEHKYWLTLAVGLYPVDDPSLPMTQLQDRATAARRQVKGNNSTQLCVCRFYSSQDFTQLAQEKAIENRMEDALKNREFLVYFQPKQDLRTREIVGAEALVRWKDPHKGLIPPDAFIPLFEKNGFVVKIDLYVFEYVCARLRQWVCQGLKPVPVSVNLSRAHLANPDFLEPYEIIRKAYNVSPELLEIELTETLVFENPSLLAQVIDKIHECGYRCSMDDFGSGNSSLNVLKNIRVDTLKLDRGFFTSTKVDSKWEAEVIGVVVELARKLGMTTVAEGVETKEQAEFLRSVGCDVLQGYIFSRPVPTDAFEKLAFQNGNTEINR